VHPAVGQSSGARREGLRIGFLYSGSSWTLKRLRASVVEGIAERGFSAPEHYQLHERFAESYVERLPALADELVRMPVDLLLVQGVPAIEAARRATSAIHIVCITSSELVAAGNVTGLSIVGSEAAVAQLDLLTALVPAAKRIGFIGGKVFAGDRQSFESLQRAAVARGLQPIFIETSPAPDFTGVFRAAVREKAEAIIVSATALESPDWPLVTRLAASRRLPAVYGFGQALPADGLGYCEIKRQAFFRRAGEHVERVLKGGARPADLAVLRPDQVEIGINLRTARTLGIEVPETVLKSAERVIG
jgi:putative tryptophan/tyrosine transport system substrate-binding protein